MKLLFTTNECQLCSSIVLLLLHAVNVCANVRNGISHFFINQLKNLKNAIIINDDHFRSVMSMTDYSRQPVPKNI